jgi:hypothetical protein
MRKIENLKGNKFIEVNLNVPSKVAAASLANKSIIKCSNQDQIVDLENSILNNHLYVRFDGINLILEANTVNENTSSFFTKQIKLPKGCITKEAKFNYNPKANIFKLIVPYYGL